MEKDYEDIRDIDHLTDNELRALVRDEFEGQLAFDPDPYKFGTPFAFSFGGGLRYVPGGRFQLRVDWNDYLYQLKYPTQYYSNTTGTGQ